MVNIVWFIFPHCSWKRDRFDIMSLTMILNATSQVLLRRAMEPDELPGGYKVGAGQDVMISVYNIHHSPQVWDNAEEFQPERFNLDDPVPNESNTDFKYVKYPSPDLFLRYQPFSFA